MHLGDAEVFADLDLGEFFDEGVAVRGRGRPPAGPGHRHRKQAMGHPCGEIQATPVISDSTVYAGSHDGRLWAVDVATGLFSRPRARWDTSA